MVTQKHIAERLGVSRQLVGFALNGGGTVSERMRQEIQTAAAEMGYRRNEIARAMVTGKNRVLGFLVHNPELEVAARILTGVLEAASLEDYSIKVLRSNNKASDREIVERCAELRLAGVMAVFVEGSRLEYLHREMERYGIPLAVVETSLPQSRGIRVVSDDLQGCRMAIAHLVSLGHRKIAFASAIPGPGVVVVREQGYRAAMEQFGLEVPKGYLTYGNWGKLPDTEQAAQKLLEHPQGPPTAIFCIDDKTAMVVSRTLKKHGFRVPEDISVVGFADLTMAEFGDPPLTTVAQPFAQMGRVAVRRLLERANMEQKGGITSAEGAAIEEMLPTRLIVRQSTAPLH